ncbi:winged helix-turn-helix transcriptional regulator [Candidatus Pacearchaeota archaeon]|nr:winged helix-turn-helix transcriptional regulator [Candidatus Pacearchaeota archaeon]
MGEKYLIMDLDDPRAVHLADVLSNKSCKKILNLLADKEMSESDLSRKLEVPLNTVEYNIKKLISAGLVEASQKKFWSVKGKQMRVYKIVRKSIVISSRSVMRGIVPAAIITVAAALGLRAWQYSQEIKREAFPIIQADAQNSLSYSSEQAARSAVTSFPDTGTSIIISYTGNPELWFILGGLLALVIILAWNWRKIW